MKTVLSFVLAACSTNDTAAVDRYLRNTFRSGNALHYEQGPSRPIGIHAPLLSRVLPQVQFYRSTIRTADFEYPQVESLIAERRHGVETTFAYRLSPTFSDDQPEFLAVFAGAPVPLGEREQVAHAIADLFAAITYKGRVGTASTDASTVTIELWNGELLWRHVIVHFALSNTIESVQLKNPRRA